MSHQNEITKSGPEQKQPDAGPDVMQQESPRKCKICGGPNHHGCGCEARQRAAAGIVETENIKPAEQPASEKEDYLEDVLSPVAIREAQKAQMKANKDIETIAAGIEGLCAAMYDTTNYLKLIASYLKEINARGQNGKGENQN